MAACSGRRPLRRAGAKTAVFAVLAAVIVGAWGAAGTGNSSRTIDHSAARRVRLIAERARRWTANQPVRHQHDCCAVQPHAPTNTTADRWGMGCGGNRQSSTTIDRSAARRARLGPQHYLHRDGHGAGRRNSVLVISTIVAPSNPMPLRIRPLGHGVRREPAKFDDDRSFRRTPCPSGAATLPTPGRARRWTAKQRARHQHDW
jgi:hypothetical protein